jgi:hypothetical protein
MVVTVRQAMLVDEIDAIGAAVEDGQTGDVFGRLAVDWLEGRVALAGAFRDHDATLAVGQVERVGAVDGEGYLGALERLHRAVAVGDGLGVDAGVGWVVVAQVESIDGGAGEDGDGEPAGVAGVGADAIREALAQVRERGLELPGGGRLEFARDRAVGVAGAGQQKCPGNFVIDAGGHADGGRDLQSVALRDRHVTRGDGDRGQCGREAVPPRHKHAVQAGEERAGCRDRACDPQQQHGGEQHSRALHRVGRENSVGPDGSGVALGLAREMTNEQR